MLGKTLKCAACCSGRIFNHRCHYYLAAIRLRVSKWTPRYIPGHFIAILLFDLLNVHILFQQNLRLLLEAACCGMIFVITCNDHFTGEILCAGMSNLVSLAVELAEMQEFIQVIR